MLLNNGMKSRFVVDYLVNFHKCLQNQSLKRLCNSNFSTDNSNSTNDGCDTSSVNEPNKAKAKTNAIKNIPDEQIKKSVFISQSHDIFTNLALEDWLYRNSDFTQHHVLMVWLNDPCVVVGRHQNPFAETNVSKLECNGVELARRNSGGGTVFHDRGNINLTFFTPRERYNRNYNLNIITRALFREWGIKAEISPRDDITLNGDKISGTAAKLGQRNAYHHCTLLVDSNKSRLRNALAKDDVEIKGRATPSIRSPVKNLVDVNHHCNVTQLKSAIGYEFLRTTATELIDGGRELLMQQRGFQLINPSEKWFPGIGKIREEFVSWEWRFGKTPKFSAHKGIQLKSNGKDQSCQLNIAVEGGIINDIVLIVPNCETPIPVISSLRGRPYTEENLANIAVALNGVCIDSVKNALDHSL